MTDAINKLIITIVAGFIVTALGLVARREIKIFELLKLAQVLRFQIHNIWNRPQSIRAEIPVDASDLKPFARYMGTLEFIVLMKMSALVTRYYELSQKMTVLTPRSDYRFTKIVGDSSDDKRREYEAVDEELSALRYEIKVIIESVSGDELRDVPPSTTRNVFRIRSVFPVKFKLWNVGNLKKNRLYRDIGVKSSDIFYLRFKDEDDILQLFSGD